MHTSTLPLARRGYTANDDPAEAARELHEQIHCEETALGIFFCSPRYDLNALERELAARFGDVNLIGCTTAGEITPAGYRNDSISGVGFSSREFHAVTRRIENLAGFEVGGGLEIAKSALAELRGAVKDFRRENVFAMLLVDGLSLREESLVSTIYNSLGEIPLFGGSAGDGLEFGRTWIFHEGAFRANAAVLTLVHTSAPFSVFKTQHFISTDNKLVVTGADSPLRVVYELNGEPAADAYAQMVDVPVNALDPTVFATHPVVVKIGGAYYVRSIQKMNEDRSLSFYCAIDEGIVLSLARGMDLVKDLHDLFRHVRDRVGEPRIVIGCDCILRNLELDRRGIKDEVGRIMSENHVIGFSTYGEQFNAMHVNQTFTGVAIGSKKEGDAE
ncbi:MAG: FIST C-terminal domain-containing protein [Candidatus Eisenbacteria bacterium]|nr:FIST C-terminal domain-containing protein [Candidatus Eisenbacteria bacterium]